MFLRMEISEEHTVELFKWFVANFKSLSKKYSGRAVLIRDFQVIKDFETEFDAGIFASKNYAEETYIVQEVGKDQSCYSVVEISPFIKI